LVEKWVSTSSDTTYFDTTSVAPGSLKITAKSGVLKENEDYTIDYFKAFFILKKTTSDSLLLNYRTLPINFNQSFQHKDTTLFFSSGGEEEDPFKYTAETNEIDFFGTSAIRKSGSISRGISFGNNQNLSVNSTLNLQLSGKLTNNLNILASISDDNIPIQASGNTNKLDEFDKVFIQVYNHKLSLTGGDFFLRKPTGYFMNYQKKAQGASLYYDFSKHNLAPNLTEKERVKLGYWRARFSGAFSKGKFARNVIQGIEGNQGPYKLTGDQNEKFIIILSGTEQVFVDGTALKRGQEFDYVIDYNTAEVVFTPNMPITKDRRIVIEFQYSDRNYARSVFDAGIEYKSEKLNVWLNGYSEQDAKNQPVLQDLSDEQKLLLSESGDSVFNAFSNSIDSIGFEDNQVLYFLTDSLGFDSVLVYNTHPDSAKYSAAFSYVGPGKGNYIFKEFAALGRVYQWILPIGGVPQGEYEPVIALVAPQRRQMVSAGAAYQLNKHWNIDGEVAISNLDINTFSKDDSKDNAGLGAKFAVKGNQPIGSKKWNLNTGVSAEFRMHHFNPIERYRAVEFTRNWNTKFDAYEGHELVSNATIGLSKTKLGKIDYEFQNYLVGNSYQGYRNRLFTQLKVKGLNIFFDGSVLNSNGVEKSLYIRHKSDVNYSFKHVKLGFRDEHEWNELNPSDTVLSKQSFRFYDWQAYIAQGDSSKNQFEIFYRQREDYFSDSTRLKYSAIARNLGGSFDLVQFKKHKLKAKINYRNLKVSDKELINQDDENTVLGRLEYSTNLSKGSISFQSFYEVGSGLELKREFIYFEVNPGQGVYAWVDYNDDGVKDLNEFELSAFPDQANYIRVFTPSNDYIQTYKNQFSTSLFLRPERVWARSKNKFLKFLSRFSNQTNFRIDRKTTNGQDGNAFNPFIFNSSDTALVSFTSSFRNTFYFHRTNPVFGADYTYSNLENKTLLASGYDGRKNAFHQLNFRWNIAKKFSLKWKNIYGEKSALADYTSGRNYRLNYFETEPTFSYQPNTSIRLSFIGVYKHKDNAQDLGGEKTDILDLGLDFRWNQLQKGSLQAKFNVILIEYNGNINSPLAFEMLDALRPGTNYTWSVGFQRKIGKNLQININYTGRKSKDIKSIHTAGMELRAYF
jgi:hypothetical protein